MKSYDNLPLTVAHIHWTLKGKSRGINHPASRDLHCWSRNFRGNLVAMVKALKRWGMHNLSWANVWEKTLLVADTMGLKQWKVSVDSSLFTYGPRCPRTLSSSRFVQRVLQPNTSSLHLAFRHFLINTSLYSLPPKHFNFGRDFIHIYISNIPF